MAHPQDGRMFSPNTSTGEIHLPEGYYAHQPQYSPQARTSVGSADGSILGKRPGSPSHPGRDGPSQSSTSPSGRSYGQTPKRAAQACLRCRRQKLRCLGGWPCSRCVKSKASCDFGGPSGAPGRGGPVPPATTQAADQRIENLEASVATLLAGMSGQMAWAPPPQASAPPPPSHASQPPLEEHKEDWRFDRFRQPAQPEPQFTGLHTSPSYSGGIGPSPSSVTASVTSGHGEHGERKRVGKGQKAEERLAAVTEDAPFKPLLYQPAVWDNREQSRRASPQPSSGVSRTSAEENQDLAELVLRRGHDDPITTELLDEATAERLFSFFVEFLHPFIPVVDVADGDAFNTIRSTSPHLLSAILAVAARFYPRYTERQGGIPIPPGIPQRLASLAEWHLAHTLLRKQHALADVQAVLLLAAWGLQSGGRGPDAWIVTGHAARIARRLGMHRELAAAAEAASVARPGTPAWDELRSLGAKWRTWLCWFTFDGFLSLGFGRPQSTQFETVDEGGFLQLRLTEPLPLPGTRAAVAAYGDAYIASQVQLTRIGRDLIHWGEDTRGEREDVKAMCRELNGRLDEWSRRWIWSNSHYLPYLGPSARISRLQAEHMRLCLNSYALKAAPEEDKFVADCLVRGLQAAMSTIGTHHESSQTDLALSFATDYLTITLAQAAVFLIRIVKAPPAIQVAAKVDPPVVTHYLRQSIEVLEASDLSETRLSTYLARTLRDIARAAGIAGFTDDAEAESATVPDREDPSATEAPAEAAPPGGPLGLGSRPPTANGHVEGSVTPAWDMDNFLPLDGAVELAYLLGLPGDSSGVNAVWGFEMVGNM